MSDMTREEAIEMLKALNMMLRSPDGEPISDVCEAIDMAIEALSAEATDVYKAHEEEHLKIVNRIKELQYAIAKTQTIVGKMVKSSEAEPTVIRSRTLMPTKDFKEWAKRIREENPNAIIIPCDAEVVSVEADWIPCSERLPNVGKDVLFCDSNWTEEGCLRADGDWWQFRWSTVMPKERVTAWMPLPMPYREDGEA